VIGKLKSSNTNLYRNLKAIVDHPDFKKANILRNNITHNYLPSTIDSGIGKPSEHKITFGGSKYTKSAEFYQNVRASLHLFVKTLECIKQPS